MPAPVQGVIAAVDVAGVYQELQSASGDPGADVFRTRRLDEAQDFVARMFVSHGLSATSDNDPRCVSVGRAYMGAVAIHAMDYGREVHITPKSLEDFYLIQVPVTGSACIGRGSRKENVGVGEASLLPAIDQVEMTWRADCRHLVLQIERAALEREAELLNDAPLRSPLDFDIRLRWSDAAMAPLRGAAITLYETWKSNRAQACLPVVEETLGRAFCQLLLLSQPSNHHQALCVPRSHRLAPRQVRRAEDFIRDNLARNITIEDIAQAAGVSPRCLFDNFRKFRGLTPMQYVRERRMEAVRLDLECAGPMDSVTAIATRWGFTQLGRFSGDYRLRFGEYPSFTLQRARPSH